TSGSITVVVGSADGGVRFYDAKNGKLKMQLTVHNGSACSLVTSPSAEMLFAGDLQNVCCWRLPDGREITHWQAHLDYSCVTFLFISRTGQFMVSASEQPNEGKYSGTPGEIRIWNLFLPAFTGSR